MGTIVLGQNQPIVNFLREWKLWMWIGGTIKEIYPFKLLRYFTQKSPRNSYALELRPDQWDRKEKALHLLPYGDSCNTSRVVMNGFPGCWVYRSQIYFTTNMEHLKGWSSKDIAETCISGWKCFPVTGMRKSPANFRGLQIMWSITQSYWSLKICFLLKFSAVLNWGIGIILTFHWKWKIPFVGWAIDSPQF